MFDFIDRLRTKKHRAVTSAAAEYHTLIHELAANGDLPDEQGERLLVVAETIGKTAADIEDDADVIRKYSAAITIGNRYSEFFDAASKALSDGVAYREETKRQVEALIAKRKIQGDKLGQIEDEAAIARNMASQERDTARRLAAAHFALLGIPEPSPYRHQEAMQFAEPNSAAFVEPKTPAESPALSTAI